MVMRNGRSTWTELPPPVGTRLLVVSQGLERGYLRARSLEESGYRVLTCGEPEEARTYAENFNPDLVVLDVGKEPEFIYRMIPVTRITTIGPILVVGATGDLAEVARCLEAGADDVCSPKISTRELDLRMRALLRLLSRRPNQPTDGNKPRVLRVGELEIDTGGHTVRKRGKLISLSPTEFRLLVTLAENAGRVVPSKALIARVWGDQYASETHYLRLYVRYLRQKLEDNPSQPTYIVNRWGSGYALEEPPKAA